MACTAPLAGPRQPFRFRPSRCSRSPSVKHWKMGHFMHKSSVWRRSCGSRSWSLTVRGMASEPALQSTEPYTKKRTRWQLHETLVLIAAKKKQDLKLAARKNDSKTTGEKWQEVEIFCQQNGIERTAQQCRNRWERIMAIYSKIKDWEESKSDNSSFWLMKPDERKAEGFQHGLDRETFKALDELYSKARSTRLSTTTIDSSKDKAVEEDAKVDDKSLSNEVDGKQQVVHEAEMGECSRDSNSIQQHRSTPEAPKTEILQEGYIPTYQSTFWLMKSTHSKQESFEDGLKCDEKVPGNDRSIALANTINESLNHLRVEECSELMSLDKLKCQVLMKEGEVKQQDDSVEGQDMFAVTESELPTSTVNCRGACMGPLTEDPKEATVVAEGIKKEKDENPVDCTEKGKSNQFEENGDDVHDQCAVTNMHFSTNYLPQDDHMLHHWNVRVSKSTEDTCKEEGKKVLVDEHGSSHSCSPMGYKEEISSMVKGLNTAGFENPSALPERSESNLNQKREKLCISNQSTNLFHETEHIHETIEMTQELAHNKKIETTEMTQELAHGNKSDCTVNCLDIQGSPIKLVDIQTNQGQESNTRSYVHTMEINTNIGRGLTVNANPSIEHSSTCTERRDHSGQKESESSDMQERDLSASYGAHHKEEVAGSSESRDIDLSASYGAQHKKEVTGITGALLDPENESPHKRLKKAGDTYKEMNQNSKKISEGPGAGSLSQLGKETIAGREQDTNVVKDSNENPAKSMKESRDGHCRKDVRSHEYDDDVFTSIQAGISRMIRDALQTIGRFFRF